MDDIDNIDVDDISAFLQITDKVLDIDSTYRRFNPPRVPSNIPRVNHVTPATAPPVIPSPRVIPPTSSSSAPRSSLTCSNCKRVGHLAATCFQAGGGLEGRRDQYVADRNRAHAHLALLDNILEGDLFLDDDPAPDIMVPSIVDDTTSVTPTSPVVLSAITSDVTQSVVTFSNEDLIFEHYTVPDFENLAVFSAISIVIDIDNGLDVAAPLTPLAFFGSTYPYNSILDSGCTHHLFRDRSVFWTYNPSLATPVKTANCGFLSTLARGSVRFRITSGDRSAVFILRDCLHAPDAPLNLLSVGALAEGGADILFRKASTTVSYSPSHSALANFSFSATVIHRFLGLCFCTSPCFSCGPPR